MNEIYPILSFIATILMWLGIFFMWALVVTIWIILQDYKNEGSSPNDDRRWDGLELKERKTMKKFERAFRFRVWDNAMIEDNFLSLNADPEFVMQYTGLKDINGKEIYEGDIVKDHTDYGDLFETKGLFEDNKVVINLLVSWVTREARFQLLGDFNEEDMYYQYSDQLHDRQLEIVGNIFENVELMRPIKHD